MTKPILEVKDLSVRFFLEKEKVLLPALNQISFHVNNNEVLGIVGESGSGKSITLLSILGLLQANPGIISGEILFNANEANINTLEDISSHIEIENFEKADEKITKKTNTWNKLHASRYKKILGNQVSMVFQNPRLAFNPYYSIGKQISESILLHQPNTDKESAKKTAIDWLKRVKMEAPELRYNNNPYGLSGGLCQRAMIAMALASEPSLLVADEPTTGLDTTIQGDILTLLEEIRIQQKLSMIIVSHDFNVMHRLANRVLVYYNGFIIEEGNTNNILDYTSDEHHPYTSLLLNTEFNQHVDVINKTKDTDNSQSKSFFNQCPYYNNCLKVTPEISNKCQSSIPPLLPLHDSHKIRCWRFEK
ncbi:MAG: ABC transporter ATP-binding protein [Gammaproteobacteria bacterium]|nr:ABC transporter ATP-binding protein [Gammaproteobacteria bacterium]